MKKYIVMIQGCDDHTTFRVDLTDEELEGVIKIARLSKPYSTYGCMPTLRVYPNKATPLEEWDDEDTTEQDKLHSEYDFGAEVV